MNLMNLTECEDGLIFMQNLLEKELNIEDGDEVAKHINQLAASSGYLSRILASTVLLKGDGKDPYTKALYTLASKYFSTLSKSIPAYQSILSKIKQDHINSRQS